MSHKYYKDTSGKFTSKGLDSHNVKPTFVRFPPDIDTVLREMKNRAEYIREAVKKKLKEDGLL